MKILMFLLLSLSFFSYSSAELMRKAHEDQTRLLKAKEAYAQSALLERGRHTWYKTDNVIQISGAALLGLLWYVSHARRIAAQSNTGSQADEEPRRMYALVRTISLIFAGISLPVSFWRLMQGIYHDYTLQSELSAFDGKLLDLENNIGFLMNETPTSGSALPEKPLEKKEDKTKKKI